MAMPSPEHQPSPTPATQGQRLRMSYEEFLAWADEDVHAEWVDGEVIVQMPPKEPHQRVVAFLISLMTLFIQLYKLGRLLPAPFEMRAFPDGAAREPDLIFIASEHLDRLSQERLSGPADLVVEVISDDSVARDRADKFYEYQEAGVRGYWIRVLAASVRIFRCSTRRGAIAPCLRTPTVVTTQRSCRASGSMWIGSRRSSHPKF